MIDFEARIAKLESEIAAMREKVSFFTVIYEKFDKTLDKLDERQVEDRKEIQAIIDMMRDELMQEIKAMREDMSKQHETENKKIEELNRWRWIVMGGAAVIGWVISKLFTLK